MALDLAGQIGVGLSETQQGLFDNLNRMAKFGPANKPLDLNNQDALIQEASKLERQGDRAGAIQLLNRARMLRNDQQVMAAQEAANKDKLGVQADSAGHQKRLAEAKGRGQLAARLRTEGLGDTADQMEAGLITPSQAATQLSSKAREDRSLVQEDKRAKQAAVISERKQAEKVAQKAKSLKGEINGIYATIAKSAGPQKMQQLRQKYPMSEDMTLGEMEAQKVMLKAAMTDDSTFWKVSTGQHRAIADDAASEIETIVEDNDAEGDFWLPMIGTDVTGYVRILSEALPSVARKVNKPLTVVKSELMTLLQEGMENKTITDPESFYNAVSSKYDREDTVAEGEAVEAGAPPAQSESVFSGTDAARLAELEAKMKAEGGL